MSADGAIPTGAEAERRFTVGDGDTAVAVGSGDVPVLGTPRLLAWCEAVTVQALAPHLDHRATSVGTRVELDHLAPTPVGGEVVVQARVTAVDGRRVTLEVSAADGDQAVGAGTVTRVVVDRERFVGRLG